MKRRLGLNRTLALFVLILAAVTWFAETRQKELVSERLSNVERSGVKMIEIIRSGREAIVLEQLADGWRMVRPYDLPASNPRVLQLLDLLSLKRLKSVDRTDRGKQEFGLDPPAMTLRFDSTRLLVGDRHPYNLQRYVEVEGRIQLVEDRFSHVLGAPVTTLVDRRLIPQGADLLFVETPEWTIYRDEQQNWRMKPGDETLSADRITGKIAAWQVAEATEVTPSETPGEGAAIRIGLKGAERELEFRISKRDQRWNLVRPDTGLAYELPQLESLLSYPSSPPAH